MKKKRYFTISKTGRYGTSNPIFRFENLDGAMEMFKNLMAGKAIDLDHEGVPNDKETPDDDGYVSNVYLYIEQGESQYHLESETIDVYTRDEFNALYKKRRAWADSFKKPKKKGKK